MNRLKAFTSGLLFASFIFGTSTQVDAQTIQLGTSGPSPSSLQIKAGFGIRFDGLRKGDFYGGSVTSAPAGSTATVGRDPNYPEWLAGCADFGFVADVPGTYTYTVVYNAGKY